MAGQVLNSCAVAYFTTPESVYATWGRAGHKGAVQRRPIACLDDVEKAGGQRTRPCHLSHQRREAFHIRLLDVVQCTRRAAQEPHGLPR